MSADIDRRYDSRLWGVAYVIMASETCDTPSASWRTGGAGGVAAKEQMS
jgi:hypothetical protein